MKKKRSSHLQRKQENRGGEIPLLLKGGESMPGTRKSERWPGQKEMSQGKEDTEFQK